MHSFLTAQCFAGGTGDKLALPQLLSCLKDSQLSAAAFDAIYAIFMWHPDPEITALMNQACSLIPVKDAAIPLLDRIIQLQPDYYEVCQQCHSALQVDKRLHHPFWHTRLNSCSDHIGYLYCPCGSVFEFRSVLDLCSLYSTPLGVNVLQDHSCTRHARMQSGALLISA